MLREAEEHGKVESQSKGEQWAQRKQFGAGPERRSNPQVERDRKQKRAEEDSNRRSEFKRMPVLRSSWKLL